MKKICVIDDDRILSDFLATVLETEYTATVYNNTESVDLSTISDYDLLLLDFNLPGTTGLSFFKSLGAPPPTVLISSMNSGTIIQEFLSFGGVSFLLKPFPEPEIFLLQIANIFTKIDEIKQKETNLKIGERYNQFMSFISHELRTPVTAISSNIRFLREDLGEITDANVLEDLHEIESNSERLIKFIDSAVDLHKLESESNFQKVLSNLE